MRRALDLAALIAAILAIAAVALSGRCHSAVPTFTISGVLFAGCKE